MKANKNQAQQDPKIKQLWVNSLRTSKIGRQKSLPTNCGSVSLECQRDSRQKTRIMMKHSMQKQDQQYYECFTKKRSRIKNTKLFVNAFNESKCEQNQVSNNIEKSQRLSQKSLKLRPIQTRNQAMIHRSEYFHNCQLPNNNARQKKVDQMKSILAEYKSCCRKKMEKIKKINNLIEETKCKQNYEAEIYETVIINLQKILNESNQNLLLNEQSFKREDGSNGLEETSWGQNSKQFETVTE